MTAGETSTANAQMLDKQVVRLQSKVKRELTQNSKFYGSIRLELEIQAGLIHRGVLHVEDSEKAII